MQVVIIQEMDRRKRLDDQFKQCSAEMRKLCSQQKPLAFGGPDYEVCRFVVLLRRYYANREKLTNHSITRQECATLYL